MNNPDLEPLKIQIRIPIRSSRIATFLNGSIKIRIFWEVDPTPHLWKGRIRSVFDIDSQKDA